ncbi:MAG: hypothetical protein AB8G95_24520 [Anaerolineae bacterium]
MKLQMFIPQNYLRKLIIIILILFLFVSLGLIVWVDEGEGADVAPEQAQGEKQEQGQQDGVNFELDESFFLPLVSVNDEDGTDATATTVPEPSATATSTPEPATAMPTATATPVPEPSATGTSTPEPATATPTATATPVTTISNTLIQLSDPLDEPEYYCIDVPGHGQSVNLDSALTAHTCKPNADDELFSINYPLSGQIYMPAYERCMEARAVDAEAFMMLFLTTCSDSPMQQFAHNNDGTIQLQSGDSEALCITVADGVGAPTGGPSHLWRELMLRPCTTLSDELAQWVFPGPTVEE